MPNKSGVTPKMSFFFPLSNFPNVEIKSYIKQLKLNLKQIFFFYLCFLSL